jgi:hypothetical protein
MIPLKDKDGNLLIEINENFFPVFFDVKTKWGEVEYPISVKLERENKDVKTMNMYKRPKSQNNHQ